uniref:RING-type domain-containing protein n=1 Tax=Caenorhabditis tropicalis TaxID=1561998 RepID=A0A1I7T5E3_9PELO
MDAEAYFPADISVVPHDEETVTASTITEEMKGSVAIPTSTSKKLMHGRKRRDPPLLSTIQEVPSMTSILPADSSIFCLLCLNKISGAVPNFVKPCHCPLVFVHTTCAIDNASFFGGTCSQCHQMYRPEQTTPRVSLSPTKSSPGKHLFVSNKASTSSPRQLESGNSCVLCQNKNYQNPEWSQRTDAKLIRPCFCGFLVHHGCISEHLKQEKACEWCGVKYSYYEYGSFGDFCRRYSVQHVCYFLLFAFLLFFFVLAFRGSYVFNPSAKLAPIALLILALFFFTVFVGAFLFAVKHTLLTRFPRFRRRYGKVTVVPYDPDVRSKKEVLRSLKASRSESISEFDNVPLNPVVLSTSQESNIETARTDPCDLSLGQVMFGVAPNPRIYHSTPLTHKQKSTVFGVSEA